MELTGVLLDTSAYSLFKRGNEPVSTLLQSDVTLFMSTIVLGELLAGFAAGSRELQNRRELEHFIDAFGVTILTIDKETAEWYARLYLGTRAGGTPIPTNDLWIASSAGRHNLTLVTFDNHFSTLDGIDTMIFRVDPLN